MLDIVLRAFLGAILGTALGAALVLADVPIPCKATSIVACASMLLVTGLVFDGSLRMLPHKGSFMARVLLEHRSACPSHHGSACRVHVEEAP